MNICPFLPVLALVSRPIVSVVAPLCLLVGCASQREIWEDIDVSTGRHQAGSSFNSDYLVRNGATLHAEFAHGSRFYLEKGATLTGLRQGVRQCTAYAESGAMIAGSTRNLRIVPIKNAAQAYADRDKPTFTKKGPGGVIPSSVTTNRSHRYSRDDDEDDYHDHSERRLPGNVSISGSSYRKKD